MSDVSLKLRKYKADNGVVNGFGALMMGPGTAMVALSAAKTIATLITLEAIAKEGEAIAGGIAPGHVTAAFANPSVKYRPKAIPYNGHPNWRAAAVISVTGRDTGDHDGSPAVSDPVVLEAGSPFNEGTKTDRPALWVMRGAVKKASLRYRDIRAMKHALPERNEQWSAHGL